MILADDIDVARWEVALNDVLALQPHLIVPGHGNLGGPEIATDLLDFFKEARPVFRTIGVPGVDLDQRDYQSCSGNLPSECRDRETMIKVFEGFAKSTPDMRFAIKDVLVSGDRVVVRGERTGTPAGDLFGVPHTGKSFRIMTIDIQTVRDGRIAKSFHSENWLSALGQVRAEIRYPNDRVRTPGNAFGGRPSPSG